MLCRQQIVIAASLLAGWLAAPLHAQEIQLAILPRGPYYVGEPVVLQVLVNGAQADQEVDCQLEGTPPAELAIQGPQVSQSKSSLTQIINGRVTSHESISYHFNFSVTSSQVGSYRIGPFAIVIDGQRQTIDGADIEFQRLQDDPNM